METASKALRASWRLLWWIPLSPLVGFVIASWLISDPWPLWQIVPLALILAAPFVVGVVMALRALRAGLKQGRVPLSLHAVFAAVAIVVPLAQTLSG